MVEAIILVIAVRMFIKLARVELVDRRHCQHVGKEQYHSRDASVVVLHIILAIAMVVFIMRVVDLQQMFARLPKSGIVEHKANALVREDIGVHTDLVQTSLKTKHHVHRLAVIGAGLIHQATAKADSVLNAPQHILAIVILRLHVKEWD